MSKRKAPDDGKAAGKRRLEEEDALPDGEADDLEAFLGGDLDGELGEDAGGEGDDELAGALMGAEDDDDMEAALLRQDSVGESVGESDVDEEVDVEGVEIPFEEDLLTSAEKLDFRGVALTPAQARRVAQLVATNKSLTAIQFDGHELPVGELREEEELEWDSEEYTDVDAIIIAEVLKVGEVAVTRLDLARNQITDDGAKALALMLVANSTLEYLNLESNMIGAKGGTAFVKAVPENTTLQYLNLQYNSLASTSQRSLRDTWQRQRSGQLGLHV